MLIGNLTRDPELRSLPSGVKVCSFSLATNRVWKDKNGARQESTDYHNVVVFGRQAETVAQYMKKGNSILVEGRMQTRSWDDKASGEKKYRTEVVADRTQFGPKGAGGGGGGTVKSSAPAAEVESDAIEYPEEDISPEDIPF
jgi:single-strand DNA-binding protein